MKRWVAVRLKNNKGGGYVILRTKKVKAFLTSLFVAMSVLVLMLPTIASAHAPPSGACFNPWRGSGFAYVYVYAGGQQATSTPYYWMEIHTRLHKNGVQIKENVNGGDNIDFISVQCRSYQNIYWYYMYKNYTEHEWDVDGSLYQVYYLESSLVKL
jgi:hypothetical protein